jgi:phosphoribosyl 1,2-cyclic phosphate phosphodiesterase
LRRGSESILIDCGPDLLAQLRDPYRFWDGIGYPQHAITSTLAVLLTHEHADHTHGINDLRLLNRLQRRPVPLHGDASHLSLLKSQFPYCFQGDDAGAWRPGIEAQPFQVGDRLLIDGWPVQTLPVLHGPAGPVTGFRFGDLAYVTDVKTVLPQAMQHLRDLDTLVLGVLREDPHPTHLSVAEALQLVTALRPRRTVFTHLGHEVRYADLAARLPVGVEPAFDGLALPVAGWHQQES